MILLLAIGAGAAGAAVAARLTENKKYHVLLLEAGGEPPFFVQIPYLANGPYEGEEYNWNFISEEQKYACLGYNDNKWLVPRGKGLGGSTLINGMVFTRGNKNDYNHWKNLGNKGWGYHDLLPYFKKLEDYQVPMKPEDEIYHNRHGPVTLSVTKYTTPLQNIMFDAFEELGYSFVDYNSKNQTGYFYNVAIMRNGSRCDAYTSYLKPNRNRKNLHIVTNAFVVKIKIDIKDKAVGVYFEKNNITYFAPVKKEVILSAGSNNSPHLLMLSGIGPREMLSKYKIKTIIETPGVGENLQDHAVVAGIIFVANETIGFNFLTDVNQDTLELWHSKREGPMTAPIRSEAIAFLNSKYANQSEDWPDFEFQMTQPPVMPQNLRKEYKEPYFAHDSSKTLVVLPILMRPKSVGHVRLRSANHRIPLAYQPNYLSNEEDVNVLLEAVKTAFRFAKTKPLANLGMKWHGIVPPGCKMHEELSDDYLKCYIRHYTYGLFHQCGTCKMGPESDELAVVDSRLRFGYKSGIILNAARLKMCNWKSELCSGKRVYGIRGLRVADISISPTIITGHVMAPSIMIGEKAAAMILEDWEYRHSSHSEL